jgi:hypothetical protein
VASARWQSTQSAPCAKSIPNFSAFGASRTVALGGDVYRIDVVAPARSTRWSGLLPMTAGEILYVDGVAHAGQ